MRANFVIMGNPVAKGRPKFSKWGAYTPEKTVNYETLVKFCYMEQCKDIVLTGALATTVVCYFPIPKSTSKKNRELMILGKIRPTKKPDYDNCAKIISDALNTIAYQDDSCIVEAHIYKFYGESPRVEVEIKELEL